MSVASWGSRPLVVLLLVLCIGAGACRNEDEADLRSAERAAAYPPGPWRLTPHALGQTVLTISHALVRYQGPEPEFSPLRAPGWRVEPAATRSRLEALRIAAHIAAEAERHPEHFSDLAKELSDDLTTRPFGGALGTWSAQLMFPEFLDALATMRVGEVSRVIETDMGFHVLMLRATPPEELVSASEIVIGYESASLLEPRDGRTLAFRSRAEAQELANRVVALAKATPDAFPRLVDTYSDHVDADRGGDIGTWSTHEAYIHHREVEQIAALADGEISEPIDSAMGFRIFRRKAAAPRSTPLRFYATELPRPLEPDVEFLVRHASEPALAARYVAQLTRALDTLDPPLGSDQQSQVESMFAQLATDMRNTEATQRLQALKEVRLEVKRLLGEQRFAELRAQVLSLLAADIAPELAAQAKSHQ
jgi:hypothetical protein